MKHKLFPTPLQPTVELYLGQIRHVLHEWVEPPYTLHVRPRYNSGAPQCVDDPQSLAEVALNEYETFMDALSGKFGRGAAENAQAKGIEHICFITWRTPTQLEVYDVMTRHKYHVPHDFKFGPQNEAD